MVGFERQGCCETLRGLQIDDDEISGGGFHQRESEGFGSGFAAGPAVEELFGRGRVIGLSDSSQQIRDFDVVADLFEIDSNRHGGGDGDHCPSAGMREVEFQSFGRWFAVRTEIEADIEGFAAEPLGKYGPQCGARVRPAYAIALKAKSRRACVFFWGEQQGAGCLEGNRPHIDFTAIHAAFQAIAPGMLG